MGIMIQHVAKFHMYMKSPWKSCEGLLGWDVCFILLQHKKYAAAKDAHQAYHEDHGDKPRLTEVVPIIESYVCSY